ncbi:MAG: hypothetical protein E7590_04085 [Ruminococcaceae bacterium]|nr:hypothetical protein [Oscillospiraceae bacterium]
MKKRWIVLLSLLLAMLLIASFFLITAGRVYEADGKVQNKRICVKDITYEDGVLYCTFINKTWWRASCGYWPSTEKMIDGEWKGYTLHPGLPVKKMARIVEPFQSVTVEVPITRDKSELVGSYRVRDCDQRHPLTGDHTIAVGYFTITEDMLQ